MKAFVFALLFVAASLPLLADTPNEMAGLWKAK
jgi:hypothetical protein